MSLPGLQWLEVPSWLAIFVCLFPYGLVVALWCNVTLPLDAPWWQALATCLACLFPYGMLLAIGLEYKLPPAAEYCRAPGQFRTVRWECLALMGLPLGH